MLMRSDPFREFDRLWESATPAPRGVPMNAVRQGDQLHVTFDLPGVDPASIDLTVEKNVLTVTAERHFARKEGDEITVSERPQGRFNRQLFLGENLDTDRIDADYEHGVLHVTIPVAEKAKPRKVEISAGGPEAVEVQTSAA